MWDHEILYADRPSKDEQLLKITFLKNQNYEYGQLNVKIYIVFCGDNS